jgi:hypothetical protein
MVSSICPLSGLEGDDGIEQSGGSDDLLDDEVGALLVRVEISTGWRLPEILGSAGRGQFLLSDAGAPVRDVAVVPRDGVFDLETGRCRADVETLTGHGHVFVEFERAVVEGAGKAEAEIDEGGLARAVAFIHAADLGD